MPNTDASGDPDAPAWVCLLRHGESDWNKLNVFTGWTDVEISDLGAHQARRAGNILKAHGYTFDMAFTSVLKRAIRTLWLVLEEMDLLHLSDVKSWRLNERHYGALQGLNKAETAVQYSPELVHIWRRSYDVRPPALSQDDPRHPQFDLRYCGPDGKLAPDAYLPSTESLEDCIGRTLPFWQETIVPALRAGRKVIVAAHGNSLRGIVKYLDGISDKDIMGVEIPVGTPLIYELDKSTMMPTRKFYLGEHQIISSVTSDASHTSLVHPSSWGLLSPVGSHVASWLCDLSRVGLIRPLGIMQWSESVALGSDIASPTTGAAAVALGSLQGPADVAAVSQQSVASAGGNSSERLESEMQAKQLAASMGALKVGGAGTGVTALQVGDTAPAGAAEAQTDTAQACAPAAVEGAVQLEDVAGLLQHSRFLVLDLETISQLNPDTLLAQVAKQLDPAQHTLLVVARFRPTSFAKRMCKLAIMQALSVLDVNVKVLAVQLPDAPPTPEQISFQAAKSAPPVSGEHLVAPPPAQRPRQASPLPASVMGLSKAVNQEDIDTIKLLLQYTGRPVTVVEEI